MKELKKDNRSLRDQLQSIQKRLFLVEQEKDQLQKEQHQLQDRAVKAEREHAEQAREVRREQQNLSAELAALRESFEGKLIAGEGADNAAVATAGRPSAKEASTEEAALPAATAAPRRGSARSGVRRAGAGAAVGHDVTLVAEASANSSGDREPPSEVLRKAVDAGSQTEPLAPEKGKDSLDQRVDALQRQLGALQGWLLQGHHLMAATAPAEPAR